MTMILRAIGYSFVVAIGGLGVMFGIHFMRRGRRRRYFDGDIGS